MDSDKVLNLKNLKESGFSSSLQDPSRIKNERIRNYVNKIFENLIDGIEIDIVIQ